MIVLLTILSSLYAGSFQQDAHCNLTNIEDPNAIVQSCFNTSNVLVPNGESVQIECVLGYYLNTSSVVNCQWGVWDDVQCVPGCPPPRKRNNARFISVKEYYNIGEEIVYTCNVGYFRWGVNHFNLICQHDSTWSGEKAGCSARPQFFTSIVNTTSLINSSVELKCDLDADDIVWLRNGKEVTKYSTLLTTSNQTLIINITLCGTCGVYTCTGKVKNTVQIGQTIYKLIGNDRECTPHSTERFPTYVKSFEDQNILLPCRLYCSDYVVQWFKDGEEILNNSHPIIIPEIGLFFINTTLYNEGEYKCQAISKEKEDYNINTAFSLSVSPSTNNICGKRRVYGGKHSWYQPWLAIFFHSTSDVIPFCYGTLLNNRWVITSAFCLESLERAKTVLQSVFIHFGQVGEKLKYTVADVKTHPLYRLKGAANDIGLVQLLRPHYSREIVQSNHVYPACISPDDIGNIHKCERFVNLNGTIVGWGSWYDDKNRNIVDTEKMTVMPKEICRDSTKLGFAEDKFCAKFNGNVETFVGDSGSPFLVHHRERSYLLGIYTWGQRDRGIGKFDYYTSIYYHYEWIMSIIS